MFKIVLIGHMFCVRKSVNMLNWPPDGAVASETGCLCQASSDGGTWVKNQVTYNERWIDD